MEILSGIPSSMKIIFEAYSSNHSDSHIVISPQGPFDQETRKSAFLFNFSLSSYYINRKELIV